MERLSEEERARVGLIADRIVTVLADRYSIKPQEVQEAMTWYRNHREFVSRMKSGGFLTLVSVLISAIMLSVWEGAKALANK
jgi:hypothetical protein